MEGKRHFAMEVNLRIRTFMTLPLWKTGGENPFSGQTNSLHGNEVNPLLNLIDELFEIQFW